jgi:S-adenosylmethionine-diacylglycerol 3-amino-3-carboxypropyl transferase
MNSIKTLISLVALATPLHSQVSEYAVQAATQPVAFAVVREDSGQDVEIIKRYFPEEKVSMLMVASGGCTAAHLVCKSRLQDLTLVDPNPAQLDVAKLKLTMLTLPVKKRLEILGYLPCTNDERKTIIRGYLQALDIDKNSLGHIDDIASKGLDFIGRYEEVFKELRNQLSNHQQELEQLFAMQTTQEQVKHVAHDAVLGAALDKALDDVMSQENLVHIFGPKATANRVQDFSRHFAERIRAYLAHHLASSSPWMAHMLLGRFLNSESAFPWISSFPQHALPSITYFNGFMDDALKASEPESYHLIHLSNILDWLSPEEAKTTLALSYRALKPGGIVIIRQLNSNIIIEDMNKEFVWDLKASREFLNSDRSFFYRNFLIGIKPKKSEAPEVKAAADEILTHNSILAGSFFNDLSKMSLEEFQKVQSQFFFAVDYFSRPMAALVARLPLHKDRIDIIHNIVEEHGDFCADRYHSNTFKQFLNSIGVNSIEQLQPSAAVNMFNYTLMGICAQEDPLIAIACNGIIEYAFADISALIAHEVVDRGWVKRENLVHYNLHADLDKQHAEEFFKIIEPYMNNPEQRNKIIQGLELGAYIFNRLYEDLYAHAKSNA